MVAAANTMANRVPLASWWTTAAVARTAARRTGAPRYRNHRRGGPGRVGRHHDEDEGAPVPHNVEHLDANAGDDVDGEKEGPSGEPTPIGKAGSHTHSDRDRVAYPSKRGWSPR